MPDMSEATQKNLWSFYMHSIYEWSKTAKTFTSQKITNVLFVVLSLIDYYLFLLPLDKNTKSVLGYFFKSSIISFLSIFSHVQIFRAHAVILKFAERHAVFFCGTDPDRIHSNDEAWKILVNFWPTIVIFTVYSQEMNYLWINVVVYLLS